MTECLCKSGNKPCVKDTFAMDVIIGTGTSHSSLTSYVGIGSSSHYLFSDLRYFLDGHVIEASEWRNLSVLNLWRWSCCCRSMNGVNLPCEKCHKVHGVDDGC